MSRLNWNNIQSPNFSGANQSYQLVADLLNRAASSAQQGITDVQTTRQNTADRQGLAEALRFNDTQGFAGAIGNLANPNMSVDTLKYLDKRTDTLQNRDLVGQKMAEDKYAFTRTQDENGRNDAARSIINEYNRLNAAGDANGARKILGDNKDVVNQVNTTDFNTNLSNGLNNFSKNLGNESSQFSFDATKQDYADTRAAQGAAAKVLANTSDRDGAVSMLSKMNPDPNILFKMLPMLAGERGNIFTQPSTMVPGGATAPGNLGGVGGMGVGTTPMGQGGLTGSSNTGAPGTREGSIHDVSFGFEKTPFSASTTPISQIIDYQKNVMFPRNKSTPIGAYQFTKDTLEEYAPKVLGKDWQSQPLSPANQEKIAEAIYNDRRDGNLATTWAALGKKGMPMEFAQKGFFKDIPWSNVRGVITQSEVGTNINDINQGGLFNPASMITSAGDAGDSLAAEEGRLTAKVPFLGKLNEAYSQKDDSVNSIVNRITSAEGGAFAGTDKPAMITMINDAVKKYGVPASVVALGMEYAISQGEVGFIERAFNRATGGTPNLGGGKRIDDKKFDQYMSAVKSNNVLDYLSTKRNTDSQKQAIDTAQQQYVAATSALRAATQEQSLRGNSFDISRYQENASRAQAQLQNAIMQSTLDKLGMDKKATNKPKRESDQLLEDTIISCPFEDLWDIYTSNH